MKILIIIIIHINVDNLARCLLCITLHTTGSGESGFTLPQPAESRVAASAGGQRSKPSLSPLLHTADLARAGNVHNKLAIGNLCIYI